jgi:hypothetical protein
VLVRSEHPERLRAVAFDNVPALFDGAPKNMANLEAMAVGRTEKPQGSLSRPPIKNGYLPLRIPIESAAARTVAIDRVASLTGSRADRW